MDMSILDIEIELMLDDLGEDDDLYGWTDGGRLPYRNQPVGGVDGQRDDDYGGVGEVDTRELIEGTFEIAGSSDARGGSAQLRNVETGDMFIIQAGDRLGYAEVSHIDASGVEMAGDDGSLYVVGVGARRGSKRKEASFGKKPFHLWQRPSEISEEHWANIIDELECDFMRRMRTVRELRREGLPVDPEELPTVLFQQGAYSYAVEGAKLEKLGQKILEEDGVVPSCDPRYLEQDKIVERYARICGQSLGMSEPDRYVEIRGGTTCKQTTPEIAGWTFNELDERFDQEECNIEYDRLTSGITDEDWESAIAAIESGDPSDFRPTTSVMPPPTVRFGAVDTMLQHRYGGTWSEQSIAPPGPVMKTSSDPVSPDAMGAIRAAGFLATGAGGQLYIP